MNQFYNPNMNDEEKMKFLNLLLNNVWYEVITGSTSYGLNNENSDVDIKMISCPPKEWFFSLGEEWETTTSHNPDIEIHSPKKIINLANKQNPTILEMLYTEEQFIRKESVYSKYLRSNRDAFLSQDCFKAYGGYATEQLMRIKASMDKVSVEDKNKHLESTLNHLIEGFRERYLFGDNGNIILNRVYMEENGKQFVDINIHYNNISLQKLSGMISEMVNTTKNYNKINNRNKKPAEKISKHFMHLIRILLNGIDALLYGTINVNMHKHREFLLDVRNEKYDYDHLFDYIKDLEIQLNDAKRKTMLPPKTDFVKINGIYQDIMQQWYNAS